MPLGGRHRRADGCVGQVGHGLQRLGYGRAPRNIAPRDAHHFAPAPLAQEKQSSLNGLRAGDRRFVMSIRAVAAIATAAIAVATIAVATLAAGADATVKRRRILQQRLGGEFAGCNDARQL